MSIIGSNILAGAAGSGVSAYEIEQSLRFDGSSKLSRASAFSNANASWTLSFWFKRSRPLTTTDGDSQVLVWSEPGGGTTNTGTIQFFYDSRYTATKTNRILSVWSDTTEMYTPGVQRDFSAWYHLVIKSAATSGTSGTVTYYLNGVEQVSNTVAEAYMFGPNRQPNIGARASSAYFSGYMAEFHYVHGTTKNYTDFGEFDDNGVWRPIEYTGGSYGANGFYLKFDPSATNGIGHDHSGNGNNWTASGFTTSGTGTDVMSDTPTTNYATLNPLDNGGNTVSNGNLVVNTSAGFDLIRSTFFLSSGKWYWEVTADDGGDGFVGISSAEESLSSRGAETANSATILTTNGNIRTSASNSAYGSAVSDGDVMMFALDMDAGRFWAGKNGTWFNSGDPAAGTNAGKTGLTVPVSPSISVYDNEDYTANFGQRDFAYTPPTGYKALNTANLPAPDIADGSDYFNTVLYTGNNLEQAITGVGFQPDWVWVKCRNQSSTNHILQDAVRGAQKYLTSDTTVLEGTSNGTIISFDSDGFTIGAGNPAVPVNNNGDTFVAWNWLAGGSVSADNNTDGSITSTVSANPTAGFSIVTWTGNATAGATVGHGLGVAPAAIFVKNRDDAADWKCYFSALGNTKGLQLNSTSALQIATELWNDTSPTSTVFSLGTNNSANGNNDDMVAYCFAEVEGYSKFGSYEGNGNNDGVFIHVGFKPKWFMLKRADVNGGDWVIMDDERSPINVMDDHLSANSDLSERVDSTETDMDFLSNGVKLRNSNNKINYSGQTFVYAAFSEHPFGGSGVSPATAR